jgi:hypothetical protein
MTVYQHVLPGMQAEAADAFSLLVQEARVDESNGGSNGPDGLPE